jgi:hypothetical protein
MTEYAETALHEVFVEHASAMPVPEDPWPRFQRRETTRRRARRLRRVAVAGCIAVAVGIQTNVVPLPGWAPGIALASPWSVLAKAPTRGSLAGDRVWLDGFRHQIRGVDDPGGLWKVADRDAIRFLYAADVPGYRVVLVLVPLRLGLITSWNLIWYDGPAGSDPQRMQMSSGTDASSPAATWMEDTAGGGGAAVVVGPVGSAVTISTGFDYSPAGVVEHHSTTTSDGSGTAVAALPPSRVPPGSTARVTLGGKVVYAGIVTGGWSGQDGEIDSQEPTDAMLTAAEQGARGRPLDRAIFRSFVRVALQDSRLAARDVTVRLRWSGTVDGQPAALFTVTPHGGGVLAYALHGTATSSRTDLRLLLPAAGADQRPIAWRMRAQGEDRPTDQVMVVAPAGGAAVSVDSGAVVTPVTLDDSGFGTVRLPPGQAAVVVAAAADGATSASTPVPLLESDSSGLPGDTPGTRVAG